MEQMEEKKFVPAEDDISLDCFEGDYDTDELDQTFYKSRNSTAEVLQTRGEPIKWNIEYKYLFLNEIGRGSNCRVIEAINR